MSGRPNTFKKWLPAVIADPIHVVDGPSDINEEARANHWAFGITNREAGTLEADDVLASVHAVEDARERQILERFGKKHRMRFYCWHSAQTAQINFSLVSEMHGRLPFGVPPHLVDDLREIVEAFLANKYHDGIPISEFSVMTQEDADAYVEPEPLAVRVWASTLPRECP